MKKRNNNSNGKNCVPIFFPYSNKIKKKQKNPTLARQMVTSCLYMSTINFWNVYISIYIYIYILYHVCNYTKTAGLTLSLFGAKKKFKNLFFFWNCCHYVIVVRTICGALMRIICAHAHTHTHTPTLPSCRDFVCGTARSCL